VKQDLGVESRGPLLQRAVPSGGLRRVALVALPAAVTGITARTAPFILLKGF